MMCWVFMSFICPSDIPVFRSQTGLSSWTPQFLLLWHLLTELLFVLSLWYDFWVCGVSVYTHLQQISLFLSSYHFTVFIKLLLPKCQICSLHFLQFCWWYLGFSPLSCLYGDLRYLLLKLIRSNLCKHSLYVGFDLHFSSPRILLNDELKRL